MFTLPHVERSRRLQVTLLVSCYKIGLHGHPFADPNRALRARALFPPLENSAGGRSVPGRRRYPRLSPIATTLTTASWEMENPRRRPSPPCGAALWGDGTQPVVALGGTEAHMRRRRGGERDEACASWLRGLALRCEPLGRRIKGVRAGASCAGSPRGREMATTGAPNGGVEGGLNENQLKM